MLIFFFFFFSSRRRHTRSDRDWSSDVCSSDLAVERLPDGSYRVTGRERVEELDDALDWSLPRGDYETVAGLVLATVHRIPLVGEEFQVSGYTFTVLEADERSVRTVRITPPVDQAG